MFDQMYDCVKLHNTACVMVHAVLMSIIFEHYKQLTKLKELQDTMQRLTCNRLFVRFMGTGKVKLDDQRRRS
jgi:hypothetical protein